MKAKIVLLLAAVIMAMPTKAQTAADVASLPSDWTRLSEMDKELVVYNTCDGGNLQLRLYKEGNGAWYILAHGQQEDYLLEVKKITGSKNMVFDCVWEGTEDPQQFIFSWVDKAKGLAKWEAIGWDWDHTFVSLWNEVDHLHIMQPCIECFDEEECKGMDDYYEPTDGIRAVFSNYVHYGESTDSKENKAAISKALDKLKDKKLSQDDLQLLINVWMYYDPTDFGDAIKRSHELLIANKSESIKALKYRIAHKREWESKDSAPYADLPVLLKEIEDKK